MGFWDDLGASLTGTGGVQKKQGDAIKKAAKGIIGEQEGPPDFDYTDSIIKAIRRSESQRRHSLTGRTRASAFGGMPPTTGFPSLLGGM